jgi:hypothetical protein
MSKEAALRAMREARYAANAATPSRPARAVKQVPRTARAEAAPVAPPVAGDELCGHRSMNGRTCTREHGHAAKSHRYS